ncbi:hypothetical protein NOR_00475 [Metarhizium rileyi]|uniref:Uncharacterized protein n=1 Tax=Metarhizium rileyi (strain RCEF 4871) TaxID=1649241 RepID=A0A167KLK7_METRR|nr:hypothetical protein NOR_00475 [Metarhizium rileyi RCEF 4871]TWU77694.1 hypothetical protein ED733_008311 [Metarhizium rileyi]
MENLDWVDEDAEWDFANMRGNQLHFPTLMHDLSNCQRHMRGGDNLASTVPAHLELIGRAVTGFTMRTTVLLAGPNSGNHSLGGHKHTAPETLTNSNNSKTGNGAAQNLLTADAIRRLTSHPVTAGTHYNAPDTTRAQTHT